MRVRCDSIYRAMAEMCPQVEILQDLFHHGSYPLVPLMYCVYGTDYVANQGLRDLVILANPAASHSSPTGATVGGANAPLSLFGDRRRRREWQEIYTIIEDFGHIAPYQPCVIII